MEEFRLSSLMPSPSAASRQDRVVLTATASSTQHPTIASLAKADHRAIPTRGAMRLDAFWERERQTLTTTSHGDRWRNHPLPEGQRDPGVDVGGARSPGAAGISELPTTVERVPESDPHVRKVLARTQHSWRLPGRRRGLRRRLLSDEPREVEMVDPQQRLVLELTWEALEHAHIPPSDLRGRRVGVFVGTSTSDYQLLAALGLGEGPTGRPPMRSPAPRPRSSRTARRTSSTSEARRLPSTRHARRRSCRSTRPCRACAQANRTPLWPVGST